LCRHATAETEVKLLRVARSATVRELRLAFVAGPSEECDPERETVSLVRRVPAEQAWELEATLVMVEHVSGGCRADESVEWLLAEGLTTLIHEAPPEVSDISEGLARRAEQARAHMRELAAEREEREAEFEPDLPLFDRVEGQAPFDWDAPLPDDVYELDRLMRELCWALDAADLWLGKSLARFFSGRQYERLGYASDGQYCRERLGMSRSSAWERIGLARATTKLDRLADAVHRSEVGFCAARLLARVVTPETEEAWVARAKARTYKHLRQEVQLVASLAALAIPPPTRTCGTSASARTGRRPTRRGSSGGSTGSGRSSRARCSRRRPKRASQSECPRVRRRPSTRATWT
jgi:hypothetical protein